jgi:phosphoribosylamine---glycine ligase
VFGPNAAAAQLEGSKGFTKDLCESNGIPTARYVRTQTAADALAALKEFGIPVVIKADGLAAGKGVTVAMRREEAEAAIAAAGDSPLVIEEFLEGEEASLFALVDGETAVPFATAQDHKRVGEGDTGPNTGGMGAYSPAPVLSPSWRPGRWRRSSPDRACPGQGGNALFRSPLRRADADLRRAEADRI